MATAKKGKKNKGKTLALSDFLSETPGTVPTMPIRKSAMSWADEVEDNHDAYESRSSKANVVLPTAPKASRDFDDIIDKVPMDAPYIAYLTNLPYDVDENEISYFFKNMKISNMRIPKDERPGEPPKLKGYGYVEFEDRESLLNALVIPDTTIKNRRIRIEVATDYDNDKRRTGRMDMSRDRSGRSDVSMGDWRSGPRQDNNADMDRRGFSRDREREVSDTSGAWRGGPRSTDRFRDDDKSFMSRTNRDSGFSRNRSDDGGFNRNRNDDSSFSRNRNDDSSFSRNRSDDSSFSRNRNDDSSFSRNRGDDSSYSRNRGDDNSFSRNRGDDNGFSRNRSDDNSFSRNRSEGGADGGASEPRRRQKLVLAPRTKPVEEVPQSEKIAASASIFGNAKPVDTSARERQIEERLLAKDNEPSRREVSAERGNRDNIENKEEEKKDRSADRFAETEVKNIEREKTYPSSKSDVNGVVEKNNTHQKQRNEDHEKKELTKARETVEKPPTKPDNKKREEKKDKIEKEMPQLKKTEPPNFSSNNYFAFLDVDDNSD